ncbi:hypothetical protein [Microbacterium azadirachtae]|uniref:Uncharacterized protein n=1 Tax=Microbacterium azadirachtae TaxID=582680 RepID=A0A0F0LHY6_9MICO|nr:hypothetical protein [Microbacterium azadirachtae]KJL32743.1 hypothetical protein RS86_02525 [Microbacterium azadirachtae]
MASVFPFGIGVIYLAPIVLLSLRPKKHFALRIGIFILVSIIVKMFGSSSMYIPGFIAFAAVTSLFVLALGYLGVSEAFWWYVTAYWLAISGGFWIAVASGSVIARFDSPSQWWLIILIQITIMFLLAAIAAKANGRVPTDTMVKLAIFTFVCLLLPYVYLVSGVPADRL